MPRKTRETGLSVAVVSSGRTKIDRAGSRATAALLPPRNILSAVVPPRGFRVGVVERGVLRGRAQEWNISEDELEEMVEAGVLSEKVARGCRDRLIGSASLSLVLVAMPDRGSKGEG